MARADSLALALGQRPGVVVSPLPAQTLFSQRLASLSGAQVTQRYGLLAHYTTAAFIPVLMATGLGASGGCWLTPIPYAACMAPYDLGISTPRDLCLLVDVTGVLQLWGPGTAGPSSLNPGIWRGGCIEFFCPTAVQFTQVRQVLQIMPCGDTH